MEKSRSKNIVKNSSVALGCQIFKILLEFLNRTVFVYILGVKYLGINGLFTNIIMILSFAELGIGNAIIYSMYKPLAINDKEKIKSLMKLYKSVYEKIAMAVSVIGISLIPFLYLFIKDTPDIHEDIRFIYILFLINTSLSYCFAYKKSIIIADQKNYIVNLYTQITFIFQTIFQIAIIMFMKNYVLYLIIKIICTFFNNIVISKKADKIYPYLKEKEILPFDKEEKNNIFTNIKSLFLYKVGSVILNGTDNIIISMLIGLKAVGISSNYVLVIGALSSISGRFMGGFTASIGNLNAIEEKEKKETVFNKLFFISAWIHGFMAIGLFIFFNEFIELWLGSTYLLSKGIVFSLVLHFYINAMQFATYTYRTTMGLFNQGKLAPIMASIINILLSIVLGKKFGLIGIFLATSIARFFTTGIVDPVLIYTRGFEKNPLNYYRKYFLFSGLFIGIYFILNNIILYINITGVYGFFLKVVIVTILFNGIMLLIFWRSKEFKEIKKSIFLVLKRTI